MDVKLNTALENKIFFINNWGVVPIEAAKLEKMGWSWKKVTFGTKRLKTGKWWDATLCIFWTPGIVAPA